MNANKMTAQRYMEGLDRSDYAQILSCLTDDVEWPMPGAFHVVGKQAFDREIENDAFTGSPTNRSHCSVLGASTQTPHPALLQGSTVSTTPSTLSRGLMLGAAWLGWFFAGLAYAVANGPVPSLLGNMSGQQKLVFGVWLLVSTTLLFYAITLIVRGLAERRRNPQS